MRLELLRIRLKKLQTFELSHLIRVLDFKKKTAAMPPNNSILRFKSFEDRSSLRKESHFV